MSGKVDTEKDVEIHVAGNSVLDLPLRYVQPHWGDAQDGWGASNVQFLTEPIGAILGGCSAATAQRVDVLIGTESELNHWLQRDQDEDLIAALLDKGPRQVVVKKGKDGAVFGETGNGMAVVMTKPVASAYTVGAGDTFNAGLLHQLSRGGELSDAAGCAVKLATQAVCKGKGVLGALE